MPLVRSRASTHVTLLLAVLAMLAATLVPASPAAADDTDWDPAIACPSDEVPASPFTDAVAPHGDNIDCLAWYQLTAGRTATTYGTQLNLRRDQTASFLVRLMERVEGADIPPRDQGAFPDVTEGPHVASVETLAAFDPQIVAGFADGTYRPADPITRAQFASIAARMLDELADQDLIDELEDADSPFDDTNGSVHEDNIARLAEAGIVFGKDSDRFDPSGDITRGQVASILARILGGLVDEGLILQPLALTGTIHEATDVRPDQLGPRIAGAEVSVSGVASSSTTTDADGVYSLWVQQPGESLLKVEADGFVDREVPLDLPDANFDDGLDIGMYRAAQAPAESTQNTSTAADVRLSNDGGFWIIGLGFSAQDADEIVLEYPNGVIIELGDAGTDDAWFSRNQDGTSNRIGAWGGTHTLYYRFGETWQRLEATFDTTDGRLTEVNGTPWVGA